MFPAGSAPDSRPFFPASYPPYLLDTSASIAAPKRSPLGKLFGSQRSWQQAILNFAAGDFLWLHFSEAVQAKCANRQAQGRRPFELLALANILNLFTKAVGHAA